MILKFDTRGHLVPDNNIEISYETFISSFVENSPQNSTRHQIFTNFDSFLNEFRSEIYPNFKVWVNGSFVTEKSNPNDIDFLIFINYEWYQLNDQKLKDFINKKKNSDLDIYFLIEYSENHEHRIFTNTDIFYWIDLFSKTRRNRSGQSFPKGFVELKF